MSQATQTVNPSKKLMGTVQVPGDKSISHRSIMFGSLAMGETQVEGLLESGDVFSTVSCMKSLGVQITKSDDGKYYVQGVGLGGLKAPQAELDCGNSGTTMRLLMGILAGQPFDSILIGDSSLTRRPMKRIADPLVKMGAKIELSEKGTAPVRIKGGQKLTCIDYKLPVSSSQLKSALLLATLFAAPGKTTLSDRIDSRNHTELMLPFFGAPISTSKKEIVFKSGATLQGRGVRVPGDISSAAFWMVAASIVKNSEVKIENVLLNPTRSGILEVLKRMGADFQVEVTGEVPEKVGSITVRNSLLNGCSIEPAIVPTLIDELPVIAILATQANGTTEVRGAEELRVKESDRIDAMAKGLAALGVEMETFEDGFAIHGPQEISGGQIDAFEDHRIAMAFSIAGLVAKDAVSILGAESVGISYPSFYETLENLRS